MPDEQRRAAKVAGWMHWLGLTELELPRGRLVLTPNHVDLHSLSEPEAVDIPQTK